MKVRICEVVTFAEVEPDKVQAVKILEEAAEVFGAWQVWEYIPTDERRDSLLDECADVIQAVCNLIAALEVDDFTPYMEACRERNEERGRL